MAAKQLSREQQEALKVALDLASGDIFAAIRLSIAAALLEARADGIAHANFYTSGRGTQHMDHDEMRLRREAAELRGQNGE